MVNFTRTNPWTKHPEPSVLTKSTFLMLQMPRFGKQFKVYDRILPSQLLDVTDVIENSPRQGRIV